MAQVAVREHNDDQVDEGAAQVERGQLLLQLRRLLFILVLLVRLVARLVSLVRLRFMNNAVV